MNPELFIQNSISAAFNTAEYHYLFEDRKLFEYQTETDL